MTENNVLKLNLGSGSSQMEGYINLDKKDYGQEVCRDVMRGLPFDDNKFDEVYASHFMEHVEAGEPLYFVLHEIWRVCKSNARLKIRVPHSDTQEAYFPDHLSWWNESMVRAICSDPYQRSNEFKYNFHVLHLERSGIELIIEMEVSK